jgi:hypothetical protein
LLTQPHGISSSFNFLATQNLKLFTTSNCFPSSLKIDFTSISETRWVFTDSLANIQMELKLRFIFIISCWPGGPTPYRITRGPDWGYLGADKFERGLSQVPGPTRMRPKRLFYNKTNCFMKYLVSVLP